MEIVSNLKWYLHPTAGFRGPQTPGDMCLNLLRIASYITVILPVLALCALIVCLIGKKYGFKATQVIKHPDMDPVNTKPDFVFTNGTQSSRKNIEELKKEKRQLVVSATDAACEYSKMLYDDNNIQGADTELQLLKTKLLEKYTANLAHESEDTVNVVMEALYCIFKCQIQMPFLQKRAFETLDEIIKLTDLDGAESMLVFFMYRNVSKNIVDHFQIPNYSQKIGGSIRKVIDNGQIAKRVVREQLSESEMRLIDKDKAVFKDIRHILEDFLKTRENAAVDAAESEDAAQRTN